MTPEEKKLDDYTDRLARLMTEKKELNETINELVTEAADKCGETKKVIKALVKEKAMSEIERAEQRLHEERVDHLRAKLGLLADLPLGEAAVDGEKKKAKAKLEAIPAH